MAKRREPEANAYEADVSGLRIRVEWNGDETTIELVSGGPGQQQAQAVSVATGPWRVAPALYRTAHGLVLVLEGEDAKAGVTIGHGSLAVIPFAPPVKGAEKLDLEPAAARKGRREPKGVRGVSGAQAQAQASAGSLGPMRMDPLRMEPMRMGDMQMSMGGGGMEMRMGDMRLRAGEPEADPHRATQRFCSGCGVDVAADDRFCSSCGKKLTG